jgi:hypothetical protein
VGEIVMPGRLVGAQDYVGLARQWGALISVIAAGRPDTAESYGALWRAWRGAWIEGHANCAASLERELIRASRPGLAAAFRYCRIFRSIDSHGFRG